MRRSFLSALFALTLSGFAAAQPLDEQTLLQTDGTVRTMESWEYSVCGAPEDIIQIESIEVTPDPPKPGQDLTVKVKGTASKVIEEGAFAHVTVKLGLIKLLEKNFDICEEARNANASVTCPVEPGTYTVQQTVALPKEIPQAKFTVNIKGYTVDDDDLLCLDLKVDFMKRPFPRLW